MNLKIIFKKINKTVSNKLLHNDSTQQNQRIYQG